MSRIKLLLFLCLIALLVAACGQRGPLYLPEPGATPVFNEEQEETNEENTGT